MPRANGRTWGEQCLQKEHVQLVLWLSTRPACRNGAAAWGGLFDALGVELEGVAAGQVRQLLCKMKVTECCFPLAAGQVRQLLPV